MLEIISQYEFLEEVKKITYQGAYTRDSQLKARIKHENYSGRFPEGLQKAKIQQWRQARSRTGEKETLNIMLREKCVIAWVVSPAL